jgi:hypothetical protein
MREEKERLLEANRAYEQRLEANRTHQERLEAGPEEKADLDSIPVRDVSLRYDINPILHTAWLNNHALALKQKKKYCKILFL